MTQVILDTSAYSAFQRGWREVKPYFIKENNILAPTIVLGELRGGFALGARKKENEQLLQEFLVLPNVNVVTISNTTTQIFGDLYAELRRTGHAVGQNDLWIASLAIENKAKLITFDKDFARIKGLDAVVLG